jgi:hypothetical protein
MAINIILGVVSEKLKTFKPQKVDSSYHVRTNVSVRRGHII